MSGMGLIVLGVIVLVTLASGAASVAFALFPDLGASPHAPQLIQMFSDTRKSGVAALIGLLVGFCSR